MKYFLLPLLALALPVAAQDYDIRSNDTQPSADDLVAYIVDRDLIYFDDGTSRYNADGSYAWTYSAVNGSSVWPGLYTVTDNIICIDFESGTARCDMFVFSGDRLTLLTDNGERYPVREIR